MDGEGFADLTNVDVAVRPRHQWHPGVAVDILQQRWYTGRVDYWIRRPGGAGAFLYEDDRGRPRDIYVSSELLQTRTDIDRALAEAGNRRVWVITSGESDTEPSTAFNADLRQSWPQTWSAIAV